MIASKIALKQLTPVLIVGEVEPCLRFWIDRLGFTEGHRVPGDDGRLAFASLVKDGIELMYQSSASVLAESEDKTAAAKELEGHSVALYFEVDDLDAIERAVAGAPLVKARHQTFYGTSELYVKEPGGNIVGFAQK